MFLLFLSIPSPFPHRGRTIKAPLWDMSQPVTLLSGAGTSAPVWWGTAALPRLLAGGCGFCSPRSINDTSALCLPLLPSLPPPSQLLIISPHCRVCVRAEVLAGDIAAGWGPLCNGGISYWGMLKTGGTGHGWLCAAQWWHRAFHLCCVSCVLRLSNRKHMSHSSLCSFRCSCYSSVHMESLLT